MSGFDRMGYQTDCVECGRKVSMSAGYCSRCGVKQCRETSFERVAYWARRLADT